MQVCERCRRIVGKVGHSCPIEVPWVDRFFLRVDKTNYCWLWAGVLFTNGYGDFSPSAKRRHILAHRFSYEIRFGEIPQGLQVCHRCDVRKCVNPDHLFLGTAKDNIHDMMSKGRGRMGNHSYGEHNSAAKLKWGQVEEIRSLHNKLSQKKIGERFGVGQSVVGAILRGEIWKKTSAQ